MLSDKELEVKSIKSLTYTSVLALDKILGMFAQYDLHVTQIASS